MIIALPSLKLTLTGWWGHLNSMIDAVNFDFQLMLFLFVCFLFIHFSFLLLLLSFSCDKLSGLVFELMLIFMVMLILMLMMIDFLNLCFSHDIQTANISKPKFEIPWGCKEKWLVSSSHFRLWVCGHQFNILLREAQGWKSLKSNPLLTEAAPFQVSSFLFQNDDQAKIFWKAI